MIRVRCPICQRLMEGAYPELRGPSFAHVPKTVKAEEEQFARTLDIALEKLEDDLRPLTAFVGTPFQAKEGVYSGEKAFQLYDTYGLPLDFMVDAAGMVREGLVFCVSANGVWLTDHVPARLITFPCDA